MAGLLVHLFAASLCALVVHLVHFNWRYSGAAFIGNLLPDIIKFGFTCIKQLTWKFWDVNYDDAMYWFWDSMTHTQKSNWLVLGFFVFGVSAYLFHHHVIKKKTMEEYDLLYVFLLIGILIHLVIDAFVIEGGPFL